ncbi:MAG: hypothetical protein VX874_12150 [Pseudomonadota bacterium]|nr:hypothetical protein [Pseudomonadota bacterium]
MSNVRAAFAEHLSSQMRRSLNEARVGPDGFRANAEAKTEEFSAGTSDDTSPYLCLDERTRAFAAVILPLPAMLLEGFMDYGEPHIHDWDAGVRRTFNNGRVARLKLIEFDTGPMNCISGVMVIFGTLDKLVHSLPGRARHK